MKTKNIKQLGILLVIMVLSVNLSFAQNNGKQQGMQQGQGGPMFVKIIPNLTADQTSKIDALKLEMQKQTIPMESKLEIKHAELKSLMASDATMKEEEAKIKEINGIHLEMQLAMAQFHHDVRDLLDEEQKVAFDKWTLNHDPHQGPGKHNNGQCQHRGMNKDNNQNYRQNR